MREKFVWSFHSLAKTPLYLHSTHGSVEMLVGSELLTQPKVNNFCLCLRRLVRKHDIFEFQITMDNTFGTTRGGQRVKGRTHDPVSREFVQFVGVRDDSSTDSCFIAQDKKRTFGIQITVRLRTQGKKMICEAVSHEFMQSVRHQPSTNACQHKNCRTEDLFTAIMSYLTA